MRVHRGPRRRRPGLLAVASVLTLSFATTGCTVERASGQDRSPGTAQEDAAEPAEGTAPEREAPYRAFPADSWWNTAVPEDAPDHPRSTEILRYMQRGKESNDGCVRLAGAGQDSWGQPVYWASPDDPEYDVAYGRPDRPPELRNLRIPRGAAAAENNDGSMTVFDLDRGIVVAFTEAHYDAAADAWSARGATVTYLDSNGLHAETGESDEPRNSGSHRGNNPAVMMVRLDEVEHGRIPHVLKVASGPEASHEGVFPMTGSDGESDRAVAPPQGLRLRIKPGIDVTQLGLDPQALVIARAMQEYGVYIGDSGGTTALKLEDTRVEGRGQLWEIEPTALCALPLSPQVWDVLPEGYVPPQPG
jgi:hypothetical protein